MKNEIQRVCIYPKDIQRITGKSYRQSIRLMQKVKKAVPFGTAFLFNFLFYLINEK